MSGETTNVKTEESLRFHGFTKEVTSLGIQKRLPGDWVQRGEYKLAQEDELDDCFRAKNYKYENQAV